LDCSGNITSTSVISNGHPTTCGPNQMTVNNRFASYYYYDQVDSNYAGYQAEIVNHTPTLPPSSTGYIEAAYYTPSACLTGNNSQYFFFGWHNTMVNGTANAINSTHGGRYCSYAFVQSTQSYQSRQFSCEGDIPSYRQYNDKTCGYYVGTSTPNNTATCAGSQAWGHSCHTTPKDRNWHTTQATYAAAIILPIIMGLCCFAVIYFCVAKYVERKNSANQEYAGRDLNAETAENNQE